MEGIMKTTKKIAFAALAAIAFATGCFGAGFALYETSARSVAMGGATMGLYHDASAVYANPALVADTESNSLLFGLSFINPGMKVDVSTPYGDRRYTPQDQWFPPPFIYYTHKLGKNLSLGMGMYMPFGLGVRHSPDWIGRFSSVETKISTYNFNPNLAWKINERLSVAAGVDLAYFDIILSKNISPAFDRLLTLKGDSIGMGGNAAVAYKLSDSLGLGLVYRSEIRQEVKGDYDIYGIPGSHGAWENITLPQSISFGANYSGIDRWNLGLIATWTDWSSYDNLTLHFDTPLLGKIAESGADKNWKGVWRFGAGAEYTISENASLAFGYVFDQDPIDSAHADYLLPPGDRSIFSAGITTKITDSWKLGLSYARIILCNEEIAARPAEGLNKTHFRDGRSNVVSLDLSATF